MVNFNLITKLTIICFCPWIKLYQYTQMTVVYINLLFQNEEYTEIKHFYWDKIWCSSQW